MIDVPFLIIPVLCSYARHTLLPMTLRVMTLLLMTRNVNRYSRVMGRWQPGARDRLEAAALELFLEQGFAATTVPQITARAGLTTRTFFRHFADKREVLFAREAEMPALAEKINEVLDKAESDGTYNEIYRKWFGVDAPA